MATGTPNRDSGLPVSICGAGLTGSMMSLYLADRGYDVLTFEVRPDLRETDFAEGRSINMALSTRGLTALRGIDLEQQALDRSIPMYGRMIHDRNGETHFQSYGRREDHINSVSRTALTRLLVDAAATHPNVEMQFEHERLEVDLESRAPIMETDGGGRVEPNSQLVVGADGAYSAVRTRLQKSGRFNYQQSYLDHGYKELTVPAGPGGSWTFDNHCLHIWPRHDFMFIALPNKDGSFTGTLFLPLEGPTSFEALETRYDVEAFFREQFPDVFPEMPDLADEFFDHPTGSLVTIRCEPFHHEAGVVLAGDAAHAMVPFYGQGMNASFEDCRVFDQLVEKFDADWSTVLPVFSRRRKPDTDAIADLALYNYTEMRSKVADPAFLWRKKLERRLHDWFPRAWKPLYSMVTFSTMPYAEARQRAEGQKRLLDSVLPNTSLKLLAGMADGVADDLEILGD